jgi:hypothetical protein
MRAAKKKPFSEARKKSNYKIINNKEYNNILRKRGRIDFMIAPDLALGWYESYDNKYRKIGSQKRYSDKAILACLEIRYLFRLKLRQTQGFIDCLFEMSGVVMTCPDYSTLSRRSKDLAIGLRLNPDKEFEYVSVDSTGVQTYTGNEWLENKHGKSYKRRIWKKLHIVIDEAGNILANEMSEHTSDDRHHLKSLLKNIATQELLGDPGYDSEAIYQMLRKRGIKPTIRPPNQEPALATKAKDGECTERQTQVLYQQTKGYHAWRVKNNYGRRGLVENTFFRFKNSFGSNFLSRANKTMNTELKIKCHLLNKMLKIGRVKTMRVA